MVLDDIDRALIRELEKDATFSSDALAKSREIRSTTIRRRTRSLIQDGIIRIVAVSDPKKLGYNVIVGIQMELEQKKIDSVAKALIKHPSVWNVWTVTGRYNMSAMAVFKSTQEFSDFMRTVVGDLDGLKSVETNIFLDLLGSQRK
jgi:Lrp/AsnC family transcriptional regulator for asnA, asnC and gidA